MLISLYFSVLEDIYKTSLEGLKKSSESSNAKTFYVNKIIL